MKLTDIILRLGAFVPRYTDLFSTNVSVVSATPDDGVVTVVTSSPHNLLTDSYVTLVNSQVQHNVDSITYLGNLIAEVVLDSDHDLTEDWQPSVTISGATQAQYNGTFTLLTVPNRRTFTYQLESAPSVTPATGTIKFNETLERGLNGTHQVTVINSTTFTYVIDNTDLSTPVVGASLLSDHRITGAASVDRFLSLYEQRGANKNWLFAVMDDAIVSKDRRLQTDQLNQSGGGSYTSILLIEPFSVFAVIPTTEDGLGVDAVDLSYYDIRNALIKSLNGHKFDSGLEVPTYTGTVFKGHNFIQYNRSYYLHEYQFETVKDITDYDGRYSEDAFWEPTRAFRDITLSNLNSFDEEIQQTNINLDEVPLD